MTAVSAVSAVFYNEDGRCGDGSTLVVCLHMGCKGRKEQQKPQAWCKSFPFAQLIGSIHRANRVFRTIFEKNPNTRKINMKIKYVCALIVTVLLTGCANKQPQQTYYTAPQPKRWEHQQIDGPPPNKFLDFNLIGTKITVGLNGCMILGAIMENNSGRDLNYMYTSIVAIRKSDKMTIGTGGINFPQTLNGGKSRAAHIVGIIAPSMGSECSVADFTIRLQ